MDAALLVLESRPGARPVPAAALFAPVAHEMKFDIVRGEGAGRTVTITRSPTTRFGAAWADEENGARAEFLRPGANDDVLLVAAIDYAEAAVSHFNPPLTAAYALLAPGQPLVQEVAMRVMDLRDPRRQRESGTATQTIEHLGSWRIRTEAGEFIADCVLIEFEAKLRMARAAQRSKLYVVEGLGVVAAEHEEKITALGLFTTTNRRTLVRRNIEPLLEHSVETDR